jgi:outer membrane protein assembly factor BamB
MQGWDRLRGPLAGLIITGVSVAAVAASADDWPAYRKDGGRSAVTAARLDFPLGAVWVHRLPQAPRPAWPDCGRAFSIFDFDDAVMPVVAGGMAYLASSADDTVYALDAANGSLRWTYTTGAPVRFAPAHRSWPVLFFQR